MKRLMTAIVAAACLLPQVSGAADSAAVLDAKVDEAIENF